MMRIPLTFGFLMTIILYSKASLGGSWIEQSNAIAKDFATADGLRIPEQASGTGYREFDSKAIAMDTRFDQRGIEFLKLWEIKIDRKLAKEQNQQLRTDLKVLADYIHLEKEGHLIDQKLGILSFNGGSKFVYNSLSSLINPQSDSGRKKAAIKRFHSYVNGHGEYKPLLEGMRDYYLGTERRYKGKDVVYPLKQEIEQYLADSNSYVKGVGELLSSSETTGWESDFEKFKGQTILYDTFVKSHILPAARESFQLPREKYAWILRKHGIDISPEKLIELAKADYAATFKRFQQAAAAIAKEDGLAKSHPADVMAHLKKDQITNAEEVEKLYAEADTFLAGIIRKHNLVTLPEEPLKIRLLGEAESKARPVPQLIPPPLVNNEGERPEFVVPTAKEGTLPFDDFSYAAAALILTAHEGRPGHDLQFSTMLDSEISTIRARYAFNSVNVEGWGLYAEDIVYEYLPPKSQLVALQTRLWRIARAFLDPEIQLGKIDADRVIDVFTKELGVSEAMAKLEVRRYTFGSPGQAGSYYYGLKKLLAAKQKVKEKLKNKFEDRCFNDGVLAMGLLPIDFIADSLSKNLVCEIKAR